MVKNKEELDLISKIAKRASAMFEDISGRKGGYKVIDAFMDIEAVHGYCPLDLQGLLLADDSNFAHDVFGIRSHLNRMTRKLEDCFSPRFARR